MVVKSDGSCVDHGVQNVPTDRGSPKHEYDLDGKNIERVEVENMVQRLTENKLVEIYKADSNVNINKRKVSPTAVTPSSKSGRVNQQLQRTRTID